MGHGYGNYEKNWVTDMATIKKNGVTDMATKKKCLPLPLAPSVSGKSFYLFLWPLPFPAKVFTSSFGPFRLRQKKLGHGHGNFKNSWVMDMATPKTIGSRTWQL